MTVFPSLDNDDDVLTLLKFPNFNLESVSKKHLEVDNNLSSKKVVRASVPFFLKWANPACCFRVQHMYIQS